ncbi:hypothetical protein BDY24DRAFT_413754 [Mrakia frigida]|uniref:uncharacterized protein n=1 Tax=Mrakia frigida TaxID=29902 RepID=UPI003FCC23D8
MPSQSQTILASNSEREPTTLPAQSGPEPSSISSSLPSSQTPTPLNEPADTSEIEELTLQHRSSNPTPSGPSSLSISDEYGVLQGGEEDERPTYDDEVGGEQEGDYDLERAGDDYADDEGEDGSVDLDGDGENEEGEDVEFPEEDEEEER